MGDHLDGVTEVLAAALLGDDLRVNLTGGHVCRLRQIDSEKPLVVADIEVCFGPVIGNEHFTMLERVHGARIDVEVGVEFLHHDAQTASCEQVAQTGRGEAFSEG
ncbi:unannotated protein [freshwater metagenome]|uniref:Unannotated protein n=1 Tax=freshwater metagenome TaxID=449393 RepID=A0A6J7GRP1_9ZZZZ